MASIVTYEPSFQRIPFAFGFSQDRDHPLRIVRWENHRNLNQTLVYDRNRTHISEIACMLRAVLVKLFLTILKVADFNRHNKKILPRNFALKNLEFV